MRNLFSREKLCMDQETINNWTFNERTCEMTRIEAEYYFYRRILVFLFCKSRNLLLEKKKKLYRTRIEAENHFYHRTRNLLLGKKEKLCGIYKMAENHQTCFASFRLFPISRTWIEKKKCSRSPKWNHLYKNRFTLKEEEEEETEFDQSAVFRKSIDLSRRPSEGRRRNADRSIVTLERRLLFPQFRFCRFWCRSFNRTNRCWINDTETLRASRANADEKFRIVETKQRCCPERIDQILLTSPLLLAKN